MKRVDSIIRDEFYRECVDKNAAKEINRRFCKHDFQHMVDVARIAFILLLESGDWRSFVEENGFSKGQAKEVIYAAGILHDIARWQEYHTGTDHAVLGAEYAGELLEKHGFTGREQEAITRAIREHRTASENMSLLGEKLYRADNLARACTSCEAQAECYKFNDMETGTLALIY